MKPNLLTFALGAYAAAAVLAACSGPSGNGLAVQSAQAVRMAPNKPPSGSIIRRIYAGLTFDGTTFTVNVHKSCGHRGLGGLKPYVAPASGPLVLAASPSLVPVCVPNPSASSAPQIYIFAIARHKRAHGAHWSGVPVAGPASLTDNPWVFTPLSPGLTMVGGRKYDFVVATSRQHKSPEPSASSSP